MIYLSYQIGCRNCLQSDGVKRMYSVIDGKLCDYEKQTEYEVAKRLERWRKEDGHNCSFCGSANVEVLEVEAGDYALYDFGRLVEQCIEKDEFSFMLNIDKIGAQVKFRPGGSRQIDGRFLNKAIEVMYQMIREIPTENSKVHSNGNFFIAITGGINSSPIAKVQRLRCAGFTTSELEKAISTFLNRG